MIWPCWVLNLYPQGILSIWTLQLFILYQKLDTASCCCCSVRLENWGGYDLSWLLRGWLCVCHSSMALCIKVSSLAKELFISCISLCHTSQNMHFFASDKPKCLHYIEHYMYLCSSTSLTLYLILRGLQENTPIKISLRVLGYHPVGLFHLLSNIMSFLIIQLKNTGY